MSLIGNVDTPASYVADYMQACVGMLGIPAGGFTTDIEAFGATNEYNVESLYAAMLNSSIGRSIYAPGSSNATFAAKLVEKLGGSLLSDDAEAWALDWAETQLDNGMSRAALAMEAVEAISAVDTADENFGTLAQQFANRIEVANYYTFSSTNPSSTVSTLAAVLSGVSNTTDVSDPAAYVDSITDPGVSTGQTFTLTTGVDSITGTTGNDTIIADNTGTNKQLSVADTISAGSGTDTLKVYNATADAIDTLSIGTVTGVETLYFNNGTLTDTKTRDVSTVTGLTSFELDSVKTLVSAEAFTVKVATGQELKITNAHTATGGTNTINLDAAAAVTSAAIGLNKVGTDTTNNGVVTLGVTGTGVTSLALSSSTNANKVTLTNTGAKLATLTVTGDANLTLAENISTLTTINASAATGKIVVDTSAGTAAATLAFTGGTGNDTLTLAAAATVKTQTLNGGAGTDTLAIKDVAISSSTTALNQGINAATNFEILGLSGAASFAVDVSQITSVSQFDVTAAIVGTAGAANTAATNAAPNNAAGTIGASFTGQTNAASFIVDANVTGGVGGANTVAYTGNVVGGAGAAGLKIAPTIDNASNAVSLTLSGITITGGAGGNSANATGTDTGGAAGSAVDLSAFETITITSNANAAGTATTNTFTAGAVGTGADGNGAAGSGLLVGANATINVSGAANMVMGAIYSGTGSTPNNNVTLNAGSLTGTLSATLGTGNDTITGGSNTNTISLGGGIDTVVLSASTAKADVITLNAVGTVDAKAAQLINITGFTNSATAAIGDKIAFGSAASLIGAIAANTINGGSATALTTTINSGSVASFSGIGASATFSTYIDGVFTAMNNAGNKVAAFEFNGDTYLVQDNGTGGAYNSATDLVVKLVGMTGVTSVSTAASGAAAIFVA